jgi:hypothetical protein
MLINIKVIKHEKSHCKIILCLSIIDIIIFHAMKVLNLI